MATSSSNERKSDLFLLARFFLSKVAKDMMSCLRTRYFVNLCNTYQTNQEKAKLNALRSVANHPLQDYFTTGFYNSKLDFGSMKSHRVTVPKAHQIQIIPKFFFCWPLVH